VLTIEDPHRFERSRSVGAYLGLVPASDRSGERDPREKRISKEGDEMLRKLLVSGAHYVLGPFGSFGPKTPRRKDSLTRGQKLKEASGRGRCEEALDATTQFMDERGGLRATAQRPPLFWRPGSLKERAKPKEEQQQQQQEVMIPTKLS
jgi:hypothetical protein